MKLTQKEQTKILAERKRLRKEQTRQEKEKEEERKKKTEETVLKKRREQAAKEVKNCLEGFSPEDIGLIITEASQLIPAYDKFLKKAQKEQEEAEEKERDRIRKQHRDEVRAIDERHQIEKYGKVLDMGD